MEKKIEPVLSTTQVLVSVWPLNQTLAPTVKYWKTVRWFLKGLGFAGLNHTHNNNCDSTWRTLIQIGRPTLMACFKPLTIHGTDYCPQIRKKKFFLNLNVIKRFYASENFSFPHFPSKKKKNIKLYYDAWFINLIIEYHKQAALFRAIVYNLKTCGVYSLWSGE